jgi:apolipoprotein N-acyltransferase
MRSLFGSLHTPSSFHPMTRRPPGRGSRLAGFLFFWVCLAGGLLQAASLAWPLRGWVPAGFTLGQPSGWLQIASLALLVFALQFATRVGQAMWRGWVFTTAWLAGTFWWLFVSMHTYGGLPPWLAALAVLALAGALALYYAIAVGFLCAWAPLARSAQALLFAGAWTLAELARGQLFTGFPWGAGGYAQVDLMAPWAPLVGVYGMGFLAAVLAYVLASLVTAAVHRALAWLRQPVRPVATRPTGGVYVAAPKTGLQLRAISWWGVARGALGWGVVVALLVSLLGGGERWRNLGLADTGSTGTLRVWLLQGNIPQDEKFVPGTGVAQALAWYPQQMREGLAAAASANGPQLVVAPETALPLLPEQLGPDFWRGLFGPLAEQNASQPAALLTGLPLGNLEAGYTNSAWGVSPEAARSALASGQPTQVHRYDKHHLVPFGEFVPPFFRWFTQMMNIPLGDFARGALPQPSWAWAGQRIAPNICYEDLFGEEIAASFREADAAPTVLVNLSNIAWFGDTVAIDQHLQISRLRALEFGRPMLRATNTGATAVIDHRGVVTHALPRLERGRLEASVEGRSGLTPYADWTARWGLKPLWLFCGVLVLVIASLRNLGRRGGRTRRR